MAYDAMLQAVRVICGFYQAVATDLAEAHNLTYRTELERMMVNQLEVLDDEGIR
jgi:hypothetical protein